LSLSSSNWPWRNWFLSILSSVPSSLYLRHKQCWFSLLYLYNH
jgi:hypothetical protein